MRRNQQRREKLIIHNVKGVMAGNQLSVASVMAKEMKADSAAQWQRKSEIIL